MTSCISRVHPIESELYLALVPRLVKPFKIPIPTVLSHAILKIAHLLYSDAWLI